MPFVEWKSKSAASERIFAEIITHEKLLPLEAHIDLDAFPASDSFELEIDPASAPGAVGPGQVLTLVNPAEYDIPTGTLLMFSGGGIAKVETRVSQGDTIITVEVIGAAIAPGETASYPGCRETKCIPAGTIFGRTFAERTADAKWGPGDVVAPDDELYLLAYTLTGEHGCDGATLLRHHTLIYENKLPNWANWTAAEQAWVRQFYHCIESADA